MSKSISCVDLAALMASDRLWAVFDVRERGEFNICHIAHASSLPRSQIEFRIAELVSDREIPVILYDDNDGRAALAASTLTELGYTNAFTLDGALDAWRRENFPVASGVNVPSKAFGEKVYHERRVPDIAPEELRRLQANKANLTILDVRTPEEYGRFCIPGAVNIPGGDLILWAKALKEKTDTTIIINCAGRTRSIIGTAALRRLGVPHVRALKNGTMGWVLAGFELESQPARAAVTAPHESCAAAEDLALRLAREEKIPMLPAEELIDGKTAGNHKVLTYLIDVRSETEYAGNHIPGSIHVPGGQAVQRADDFVAVRNARVVFVSYRSVRAVMAAYWYRAMGFAHAAFLAGGLEAWIKNGGALASGAVEKEPLGAAAAKKINRKLAPAEVHALLRASSVKVLDVGSSLDFEAAHLPGAQWISRGWIELKLPGLLADLNRPVITTCRDGQQSMLAARTLAQIGYREVFVLDGGVQAWASAGHATAKGLDSCLLEPNDMVLSPSIRGSQEDMRRYLEWELKL